MLNTYWKQFKSGTDIRGVASEGVAGQEVNLTDEAIERLGYKSTPVVGFHALAQSLLDEGYTLFGVPGFYRDKDGRWTMAVWRRGILIPGTYFDPRLSDPP